MTESSETARPWRYFMHLDGNEAYVVAHPGDVPGTTMFNEDVRERNLFEFRFRLRAANDRAEAERYINDYRWYVAGEWQQHALGIPYVEVATPSRSAATAEGGQ